MSKHKKSKKLIDKLHKVLDNNNKSSKNLDSEEEKQLDSLSKRLKKERGRKIAYQESIQSSKDDNESLQPEVTVYPREKKKKEFTEVKIKVDLPKTDQVRDEISLEDEALFDIEKKESYKSEFVEVKPKSIEKKETKKEENEEKLSEWEPVEISESAEEEVEKETEKKEELIEWSEPEYVQVKPKTSKKEEKEEIKEGKVKPEEQIETVDIQPIATEEKEIESEGNQEKNSWEPIETTKKTLVEESPIKEEQIDKIGTQPTISKTKEQAVKEKEINDLVEEFESIDKDTAILLIQNGYISNDILIEATYKELKRVKGLKRRKAKKITKEINKKIQEKVNLKPIETSETGKGKITKEETQKTDFLEEKEDVSSSVELSSEKNQWKPVQENGTVEETESLKDEEVKPEQKTQDIIEQETTEEIKLFENIDCIDDKVANTLYLNGYTSIEELKNATYKDLKKIKGISRKTAKNIIKELEREGEWGIIDSDEELKLEKEDQKDDKNLVSRQNKIDLFKEIENIDEDTAIYLYDNGFKSIEDIRNASVEEISKIKEIKKRKAKGIKKEINRKFYSNDKKDSEEEFTEHLIEDNMGEDAKELDEKIKNYVMSKDDVKEEFFVEEPEKETSIKESDRIFEDIKSIDEKIEQLLIENGIDSIEKVRDKRIKDLTKIKGIRRKIAKNIKKEIKSIPEKEKEYDTLDENPYIEEKVQEEAEWEYYEIDETEGKKREKQKGYKHKEYTLYEKETTTKKGNKRKIRFFSKKKPDDAKPIKFPNGYIVKENKKTGVPYLKKKNK